MAIIRLSGSDVVANAIILLNEVNGRRTLTTNEYRKFWSNLIGNSKGIEVLEEYVSNDEELHKYFDIVNINSGMVYRLKPFYDIDVLRGKFRAYLPLKAYMILSNKSLVNDLNDLSLEDEKEIAEFKALDEKYQLKLMHELFDLEKKRRLLEQKFNIVKQNSVSLVDDIMVESIFEKRPGISADNLIDVYQNDKSR